MHAGSSTRAILYKEDAWYLTAYCYYKTAFLTGEADGGATGLCPIKKKNLMHHQDNSLQVRSPAGDNQLA